MNFTLEDFIPEYPDSDENLYQWQVTKHREFNILATSSEEKAPKRGDLFKHQELIVRLMNIQDRILMIHETGTGKTCALVAVAEYFKEHNISEFETVYVLEKGDTTKQDFINQIINKCTPEGTYSLNKENDYRKWYKVMTYGNFVRNEMAEKTDEELYKQFSGCLFFIDEAHNIRNFDKTVNPGEDRIDVDYDDHNYNKLKKLFRIIERSKVVISTATPMINEPSEVGKLIDLLNYEDMPSYDWSKITMEQLNEYASGKISFVRSLDTGIDQIDVGDLKRYLPKTFTFFEQEPEPEKKGVINVKHLFMNANSYQDRVHIRTSRRRDNSWLYLPKLASSFVAPVPLINDESPSDLIVGGSNNYSWNDIKYNSIYDPKTNKSYKLSKYLSNYNRLYDCSCKFAFIVQNEVNYYLSKHDRSDLRQKYYTEQDIPISDEPYESGNCFIYDNLVKKSGTIYLGLILENFGFERFTTAYSVVERTGKIKIAKKLRYGIIRQNSNLENSFLLELFNHPANSTGDYIQVIIGSAIARDGINLSNVTRGYLVTPEWHISGMYQAMSRFLRATSHVNLLEKKNLETRVQVKIYRLSAVNSTMISTDDHVYNKAEEKDFETRRVMRHLKQIATDCMINYNRNVRDTDIPYSADCDYQECDYTCSTPAPPRHVNSESVLAKGQGPLESEYFWVNYNMFYHIAELAKVKFILTQLFETGVLITFENLINLVKYHRPELSENQVKRYVYDTIERTISSKDVIVDIFGYENYIQTDGINIFAQREYPQGIVNYQDSSYYTRRVVGVEQKNAEETYRDLYLNHETLNPELEKLTTEKEVKNKWTKLVPDQKIRIEIFEKAVIDMMNKNTTPFQEALLDYYYMFLYRVNQPLKNLKRLKAYISQKAGGPGAKPTPEGYRHIQKDTIDWSIVETDTPFNFVHVYREEDRSKYTRNIFFRPSSLLVRILRENENGYYWDNLDEFEEYIYPYLVCQQFEYRTRNQRRRGAFGYIWDDQPNDIILAQSEPCIIEGDTRRLRRGSVCSTKLPKDIFIYFTFLEASEIEIDSFLEVSRTRALKKIQSLIPKKDLTYYNVNLNDKSDEWLLKIYTIVKNIENREISKSILCSIIKESYLSADMVIFLPKL